MAKNKYYCLSDRMKEFKTGYLIVQDTLFQFDKNMLVDYWELESSKVEDKVAEAREVADLSPRTRIYYDDEGCFSADAIICNNGLIEEPLTEDEESLAKYFFDH